MTLGTKSSHYSVPASLAILIAGTTRSVTSNSSASDSQMHFTHFSLSPQTCTSAFWKYLNDLPKPQTQRVSNLTHLLHKKNLNSFLILSSKRGSNFGVTFDSLPFMTCKHLAESCKFYFLLVSLCLASWLVFLPSESKSATHTAVR